MAPGGKEPEQQWPPRSPHEALLSTPKGRERYREMLQTSPSPSPSRGGRFKAGPLLSPGVGLGIQDASDDGDEDDEETLQLKLQEIQAKLRLKKLQNARGKADAGSASAGRSALSASPSISDRRLMPKSPGRHQNAIQVPASPVRKLQAEQPQTSPSRVLLGIDKGLTAKDISLKRAPSHKRLNSALSSRSGSSLAASSLEAPQTSSFNERLAGLRSEEAFRKERQAKIQSVRSNAFGIGREEMDVYKKDAVEIPNVPLAPPTFTRDQVLGNKKSTGGFLTRSRTVPSGRLTYGTSDGPANDAGKALSLAPTSEQEQPSYELYSTFHLSRRILPHNVLTRGVSGKKSYNIKDLLRDVKAPDFSLPDIEQDIVVFGILAKKSEPRSHKPGTGKKQDEDRGKYMVMTLVDLDFEVDLFLFNSGFERFWKLSEGTVIAILNPNIMPPPPGRQDTGRFSLVINSDEDTILEIGIARDLGFCKSVKKDGNPCGSWLNKKRTEFCEYHSNEAVKKQKSSRIEMNNSGFGGQRRAGKSGAWGQWQQKKESNGNFHRETQTHWFATRSMSSADLIDGKDISLGDRKERAEFLKRSLEAKEKEREIMNKLGQVGSAAGREYMKFAGAKVGSDSQASGSRAIGGPPNTADSVSEAATLDLLRGGTDRQIHLSPVKRKRNDSSQSSVVTTASNRSSAYGWGNDLKEKLSSMKAAGAGQPKKSRSPVRKKTRFVTEKGIREAGRESLGMDLSTRQIVMEDDDDDLEIIH
ncbi:DNA replication licensing factor mcm10 [Cordyceps javanica]|uniref:DNA replication licensing factor mcm10 n=1 Tax=Cordyceps javanica TaxID=43265 RepID=A0A545W5W1_9HYPO|nr:DNA replication licensing factor mcm10 [Cordyceps javanica]TQW09377.1 DNA replication licensing factor mcm10 [Cordyceps javanica]